MASRLGYSGSVSTRTGLRCAVMDEDEPTIECRFCGAETIRDDAAEHWGCDECAKTP